MNLAPLISHMKTGRVLWCGEEGARDPEGDWRAEQGLDVSRRYSHVSLLCVKDPPTQTFRPAVYSGSHALEHNSAECLAPVELQFFSIQLKCQLFREAFLNSQAELASFFTTATPSYTHCGYST